MVGAAQVRRTADVCSTFLRDHLSDDWSSEVPDLDMSVVQVVAHAAEGCLWYAIDLAAGGGDLQPVEHRVKSDGEPSQVVATLHAYAEIVASVIDDAPDTARGFHPMGQADPSGFAAMACDEMLVHTDDAARGHDLVFDPPVELADAVLRRLFPWVAPADDPWARLRWANGRLALDDQPRLDGWAWHCAPLADWDGTVAAPPQSRTGE
jgi:hypothetical protein